MTPLQTRPMTRQQIGQFIPDPRGVRAFEALQADTQDQYSVLTTGQFLTLDAEPNLGAERQLALVPADLTGTDAGANSTYTLGLASTAVTPGTYGDASHTVSVTFDAKGRATAATAYALSTSNITEGSNQYFTTARARAALSAGAGISYNSATGVITATGSTGFSYSTYSTAINYTETATTGFKVIFITASGKTVTLPTAVGNAAMFTVRNTAGASSTLAAAGAETINGSATITLGGVATPVITIISDGANWWGIGL